MSRKGANKRSRKVRQIFKNLGKWLLKLAIGIIASSVLIVLLLRWINPVSSSIMVQRQLALFFNGEFDLIKYNWTDYEDFSEFMPIAVVASEDQNFPNHFGFDFKEIQKAIKENKEKRRIRGASTITQQVAKNLFLWEGKSFIRKGVEAYFTLLIEVLWDKRRILEVHMNIAEMGSKIFGVGAASQIYFKKSPKQLSKHECALLAAVLPNPRRYSAVNPSSYIKKRQNWIITQIGALGGPEYLKDI